MHLLPHKSWNVWSKKNIEKVKQDEQKAKDEIDKKRKREIQIVLNFPIYNIIKEQERRFNDLKDRVKKISESYPEEQQYNVEEEGIPTFL